MSARSEMTRSFATSFSNVIDSGLEATRAYSNSQYNRLDTQVRDDYNAFIDELQYDNDFESYEEKVDAFWAQEDAKIREGGYGSIATNRFMDQTRQVYYDRMRTSAKEMMVDGSWRQAKVNYDLACRSIISDDVNYPTYDDKMKAIKAEYENDLMGSFPLKLGTVNRPEDYSDTVKTNALKQAFNERKVTPYADLYYSEGKTIDEVFGEMKGNSGISEWSEVDEETAKSYIQTELKAIGQERKNVATNAQSEISSKYLTKSLNGEEFTVQDIINDCFERGAFREDGSVDPFWNTYVSSYLDEYLKEKEAEEAAAQYADTVDNLTVEGVLDSATSVMGGNVSVPRNQSVVDSNRGFRDADAESMSGLIASETPYTMRQKETAQPYSRQRATEEKASRLAMEASGIEGLDVDTAQAGSVVDASRGFRAAEAGQGEGPDFGSILEENGGDYHKATLAYAEALKGMGRKEDVANMLAFEEADRYATSEKRRAASEIKPEDKPFIMDSDYTVPEEYPGPEGLSDRSAALAEAEYIKKATQDTMFANAYKLGGDINWSAGYGKQTYKSEGQEDFQCDYAPIVAQYCRDNDIAYDTKSAEVYAIAQMVQAMGDAGYFSDPNKSLAIQVLSAARNDPEQATTYSELALSYVSQGVLTPDELKDYGLDSSAYNVSQLSGTKYAQTLDVVLDKGFTALFGDVKGKTLTAKENNLTPEQSILWQDVKTQMTNATQTAFYSDATGAGENYLDTAQQIIDKYANTAWTKQLYKDITSNIGNVVVVRGPFSYAAEGRRYDEYQTTSEILGSYFSTLNDENPKYSEFLDDEMVEFVVDTLNPITTDINSSISGSGSGKSTKKKLNEISQKFYSLDMDDKAMVPQWKSTVLFSYIYGQTQVSLTKEVCTSFGYDVGEVYGNVVVHPTNGQGGGFAVVTKDGRVYMSAGVPDGSGHKWMIGSVDNQTLKRIGSGLTDLSYNDIAYNGIYQFDDNLANYGKEGYRVSGSKKDQSFKEQELNEIYRNLQPSRFKY